MADLKERILGHPGGPHVITGVFKWRKGKQKSQGEKAGGRRGVRWPLLALKTEEGVSNQELPGSWKQ